MMSPEPKVAIYARVSSDQQAEAGTIESQIVELLERVERDALQVPEALRFLDEGYSGSSLARPALERLRDLAHTGGVELLYVHSPDRLARSFVVQAVLLEELQSVGVEVRFLNGNFGESPEQQLLLQMQGVIAEYERAKILERSRRGRLHAARRGSINVLSTAAYGYEFVRSADSRDSELRVRLDQASVVREIFQWFALERVTIQQICSRLQAQGVSSPSGLSTWNRSTVHKLLKNPVYRGLAAYGKTRAEPRRRPLRPRRGAVEFPRRAVSISRVEPQDWIQIPVPAIVSEALFEQAQEQLQANRRVAQRRAHGETYLLGGLVLCGGCGYSMPGRKTSGGGKVYTYYRCLGTEASRFAGQRPCECRATRADLLDALVWEDVCELLQDPSRLQAEYERRLAPADGEEQDSSNGLKRLIGALERGRQRLIDAYQDGLVEKSEFAQRCSDVKKRLSAAQTQLEEARRADATRAELRLVMTRVEDFAAELRAGLDNATWRTRREIIRALVKRIEVDEEGARVVYRVDPPPFVEAPGGGHLQLRRRRAWT